MKVRVTHFKNLSAECWHVQAWGLKHCQSCKLKEKKIVEEKGSERAVKTF